MMPDGPLIDSDLFCVHCGYNLRTLEVLGRCPECGGYITDSTRHDSLAHADGRVTRRIALGLCLMVAGPILLIVLAITQPTAWILVLMDLLPGGAKSFIAILADVIEPFIARGKWIGLAHFASQAVGIWLVTTNHPAPPVPRDADAHRRICRGSILVAAGLLASSHWFIGDTSIPAVIAVLFDLFHMAITLGYVRRIGQRAGDEQVETGMTTVMIALAISFFLLLLGLLIVLAGGFDMVFAFLLLVALNQLWSGLAANYFFLRLARTLWKVPIRDHTPLQVEDRPQINADSRRKEHPLPPTGN